MILFLKPITLFFYPSFRYSQAWKADRSLLYLIESI